MNVKEVRPKSEPIILMDGKKRHLRFTLNALAELEDKYGSVDAAFNKVQENSVAALRFVLWAGLCWEDEELTERQVGNLIDLDYMQEMVEKLGRALDGDVPIDPQDMQEMVNKLASAANGDAPVDSQKQIPAAGQAAVNAGKVNKEGNPN